MKNIDFHTQTPNKMVSLVIGKTNDRKYCVLRDNIPSWFRQCVGVKPHITKQHWRDQVCFSI